MSEHPNISKILYPLRQDHPDFATAQNLLGNQGCNMVSFELAEKTREAANRLVENLQEIAFAPTLGDIGTTLSHPASSSHRGLSIEERSLLGISEGFFRVSVGIEDGDTLIDVFSQALSKLAL